MSPVRRRPAGEAPSARRAGPLVEELARDLRFAARSLRRRPGFAAVAVITLAVGIGASTAMFSVLDSVLLRPLPVRDEAELVVLRTVAAARSADHLPVLHADLEAYRERTGALSDVAGLAYYGASEKVLLDRGRPLTVSATWVTGGFFPLLGVAPLHGRTLLPADDVPGAAPAMVIGHGLWQRYFGADPAAVGHAFEWDGRRYTVVGVLPPGFAYPAGVEVWLPVLPEFPKTLEAGAHTSQIMVFDLVGRLAPGGGVDAARADYQAFLRATDPDRPAAARGRRAVLTPLPELIAGDARPRLWAGAAAVALLLLIACVNVANLLLVRGSARGAELAVRRALGAGRPRLVRQLLTESAVLAGAGGALGVLAAFAAVRVVRALAPPELPRREMIGVDGRVLLFALAVTAVAAVLAGLLPALLSARGDATAWLRGGRGGDPAGGRGARLVRRGLVVGQVSLAVLVVVAAGLLVRSVVALERADMGFDEERLLVLGTVLPPQLAADRERVLELQERALERLGALPGVTGVAALPARPFSERGGWDAMYTAEGQSPDAQADNPWVNFEVVGPSYFETLRVPVRRGRVFEGSDRADAPPVAVISEAVARHAWPGLDPLGRRIKLGPPDGPATWHTVVGVVAETRYRDLAAPRPTLYLPIRQFGGPVPMSLAVRTAADPGALVPQVRAALREVHPELMLVRGGPMRELMAAPLARPRFTAALLGGLAAVILLLGALGIYGVMATAVRQRTREIAVRLALGARGGAVAGRVLGEGLVLVALGTALGLGASLLTTRLLRSLLFGVTPTDPVTWLAAPLLLLGVALLASWAPARRAARVDPMVALRQE